MPGGRGGEGGLRTSTHKTPCVEADRGHLPPDRGRGSRGYEIVKTRQVLVITVDDRPGELGRYCRRLADSGIHISSAYVARRSVGETEVILAVDDLDQARKA